VGLRPTFPAKNTKLVLVLGCDSPTVPLTLELFNDISGCVFWILFHFFLKTNVLCSLGHKMLGLGTGVEWPETGNSVAVPAL
jgi:hypothetical protein